ncbi:sulfate respiration complex hexadecaheme cytochrome HmcA [Thermodesulfovibrio sp. TK110]
MKKFVFIGILLFVAFSALGIYALLYSEPVSKSSEEGKDIITIAHKEIFGRLEYGTVLFEHQRHVKALTKAFKKPDEMLCQECHVQDKFGDFSFEFPKNIDRKDSQLLKNAYHEQCLKCHQKLSFEKIKTGPVILSCRDCHKKEYEDRTVKYPSVEFDFSLHGKHVEKNKKDCSLCHHTYDIEEKNKELALFYEKGTEESCYYCHDLNKKRGPELSKIVKVVKQSGWSIERAFHSLCLNCHLHNKLEAKEAGPLNCSNCHTGKYKTVDELKDIPRPERDQPKTAFINIEEAKMKGVPFNHEFHEKNNKSCRSCHHERLKSCKECHNLKGKQEGGFVNILTAYHSHASQMSCQGCHRSFIEKKECQGCHYFIAPIKTEITNKEICARCHSGKKEVEKVAQLSVSTQKVKKEVIIKHIEKEFEPAKMPHYKIVKKLTDISNQSRLATYFHKDLNTICKGCHHKSKEEAEAKKDNPPICKSCHGVSFDSQAMGRPRLQAAYHTMCIKCHEKMELQKPKTCTDCHERRRRT